MTDGRSAPEARARHRAQGEAVSAERFAVGLAELRSFVAAHGHARVPARYDAPSGYRLGQWCWWLRGRERTGKLPTYRLAILDALGFPWHPRDAGFERGLAEFTEARRVGPLPAITPSGFNLARWIKSMRGLGAAGELDPERTMALDATGFQWQEPDHEARRFTAGLAALDDLVAEGSGAWVPSQVVTAAGFRIGCWLRDERKALRAGRRTKRQRMALRARGVTNSYNADRVAYGLASFVRFREAHPTQVPASTSCDRDGFPLGGWFTVRRREARAGTLDPGVARKLAAMGVELVVPIRPRIENHERQFDSGLAAYGAYVTRTGRRYPPRGELMPDGRDLSVWVMNLRINWRLDRLPPERVHVIEKAGLTFPESPRFGPDASFATGLAALRAFVAANGHDRVPVGFEMPDGRLLAGWCSGMRRRDRAGALDDDRRAALLDAGLRLTGARSTPPQPKAKRAARSRPDHLGARLHEYRLVRGMPLDDLAVALGVSIATIHSIENRRGIAPIKIVLVGRIGDLIGLDRPTAALLGGWPPDDVAAMFGASR